MFLGTLHLAAISLLVSPFSRSLSAWYFLRRCVVGVFSFSCHQHFNNRQYHNVKTKQVKEHAPVFGKFQSIKAFQHLIQAFENLNIPIFTHLLQRT